MSITTLFLSPTSVTIQLALAFKVLLMHSPFCDYLLSWTVLVSLTIRWCSWDLVWTLREGWHVWDVQGFSCLSRRTSIWPSRSDSYKFVVLEGAQGKDCKPQSKYSLFLSPMLTASDFWIQWVLSPIQGECNVGWGSCSSTLLISHIRQYVHPLCIFRGIPSCQSLAVKGACWMQTLGWDYEKHNHCTWG